MLVLTFLFKNLVEILILIFLFRVWMYWAINDIYNVFAQFIISISKPIIKYIQSFFPNIKNNELISLFILLFLAFLKYPILVLLQMESLFNHNFIFYIFVTFLTLFKSFGYLVFWLMTIHLISNWIYVKNNDLNYILQKLTNSILEPIQNRFPMTYDTNIIPYIINSTLYFLNFVGIHFFPQFWFLI
ncbi:hypothetical protein GJT88_01450 [Enterobacteriaceae endosymbiont of Donacia tomentosa]|uniref:YggT family protein n=1 Tax=Enterobacteriaceae endosymbiont of Donacia tomentosa TaxID=2675787 RepID=UPI001448F556|nr:YggT family protein [Enterobacteriaceae endosymbiont of Donacia tomentosa]QJC31715.1 hypothetical protein GJT88_01450 [Enterobacteriaceae endosymbiont of Donacia tomentosa]